MMQKTTQDKKDMTIGDKEEFDNYTYMMVEEDSSNIISMKGMKRKNRKSCTRNQVRNLRQMV